MASVRLTDIYNRDLLASYIQNDSVEKTAFADSGVLVTTNEFSELLNGRSAKIELPYWNDLDASIEPNYSNDNPADIAVPLALTTGVMGARIAHLNEGWAAANLDKELTSQDPLSVIGAKINRYWKRQMQRRLIATTLGVYAANVAQNSSDMVVTDAANGLNANIIIDAVATMGDSEEELGAIVVHSKKYADLQKQNLIQFVEFSDAKVLIATYQGKRLIKDDSMPVIGTGADKRYLSIVFGAGSIGYGFGQPGNAQTVAYEDARANGGGVETLWTRRKCFIHPLGYSFTSATITGNGIEDPAVSASWSDLTLAANWKRVYDRKNVPIAFILTK